MSENRNFVFFGDYWERVQALTRKCDQDELLRVICQYGATGECNIENDEYGVVKSAFIGIKPGIDRSLERYKKAVSDGKTGAASKTKKVDDSRIGELAKQGYSAKDISEKLGISRDTVYHSDGWKRRKELDEMPPMTAFDF